MQSKILARLCVATDFSADAEPALATAASLARTYAAQLDLVSVVPPPPTYAVVLAHLQSLPVATDDVVARVADRLAELCRAVPLAGLPIHAAARVGVPYAEILAHARENEDDVIVVGSKSRGDLESLLLGRTAERVLRKSPVPVLVAKRALSPTPRVLVASTDFSPASVPALQQAAALARQWGARLILVHALEPAAEVYGWGAELAGGEVFLLEPEALDPEWRELLRQVDLSNVTWEQRTRRGYAAAVVSQVVHEEKADLLVIGTHGRSALPHALLGSVAEAVIRQVTCCVLTMRPDASTFRLP